MMCDAYVAALAKLPLTGRPAAPAGPSLLLVCAERLLYSMFYKLGQRTDKSFILVNLRNCTRATGRW